MTNEPVQGPDEAVGDRLFHRMLFICHVCAGSGWERAMLGDQEVYVNHTLQVKDVCHGS